MKKILGLTIIAFISVYLSACGRNLKQDVRTCENVVTTMTEQLHGTSGEKERSQVIFNTGKYSADACFNAGTTDKKFYLIAWLGYLNHGMSDRLIKTCKILSKYPNADNDLPFKMGVGTGECDTKNIGKFIEELKQQAIIR